MALVKIYNEPIKIEISDTALFVDGAERKPDIRHLSKMLEVFATAERSMPVATALYYMYRNVYSAFNMRYDITIIPANMIGNEFVKTYGHYHPIAEDNLSYPEVYQVLQGSAMFMMQSKNSDASVNVIAATAEKGDVILFPPNYGHVSINKDSDTLILANLVSNDFQSIYEDYELYHGAALYYTADGLVQNTNYVIRSSERIIAAEINKKYDFECKDILTEFYSDPAKFEFLKKPSLLGKK